MHEGARTKVAPVKKVPITWTPSRLSSRNVFVPQTVNGGDQDDATMGHFLLSTAVSLARRVVPMVLSMGDGNLWGGRSVAMRTAVGPAIHLFVEFLHFRIYIWPSECSIHSGVLPEALSEGSLAAPGNTPSLAAVPSGIAAWISASLLRVQDTCACTPSTNQHIQVQEMT